MTQIRIQIRNVDLCPIRLNARDYKLIALSLYMQCLLSEQERVEKVTQRYVQDGLLTLKEQEQIMAGRQIWS